MIMWSFIQKANQKRTLYVQIIFSALAFITVVAISYFFMSDIVRRHLVQNTESLLEYEQYKIESVLQKAEITLDNSSRSLREMILQGDSAYRLRVYIDDLTAYLVGKEDYALSIKGIYGYFETLPDGPAFFSGFEQHLPHDFAPTRSIWYRKAVEADGETVGILTNEKSASEETILTYALCIFDDAGRRLGVVCLDMQFDEITNYIARTAGYQGGLAVLISNDLTLLSHFNQDFVSM
ncbi:MAG: cache domain-containing protein, partial [Treponema sp.]|nr:cache domain-containing protein [Treponema sp.]